MFHPTLFNNLKIRLFQRTFVNKATYFYQFLGQVH
jgi:hypothetical protein